jgi:hypothetical protein
LSTGLLPQVLMSCMGSFASIVVLLVLFWLVFSIMGLHVFGGLTLDEPWPNHDDMINSLILNFNVRAELVVAARTKCVLATSWPPLSENSASHAMEPLSACFTLSHICVMLT